jgi:DNA-binding winged helix-turn-helix (wHTH) protein
MSAAPILRAVTDTALVIDATRGAVEVNGEPFNVTGKELALLRALADNPSRMVSKDELLRTVWGYGSDEGKPTRTLDTHACRLRTRLASRGGRFIVTVWGQGFRLVDPGCEHTVHVVGPPLRSVQPLSPGDEIDDAIRALERARIVLWRVKHGAISPRAIR